MIVTWGIVKKQMRRTVKFHLISTVDYRGQYTPVSEALPDGLSSSKDTRLREKERREEGKEMRRCLIWLARHSLAIFSDAVASI